MDRGWRWSAIYPDVTTPEAVSWESVGMGKYRIADFSFRGNAKVIISEY
jgi:hypothetical protein